MRSLSCSVCNRQFDSPDELEEHLSGNSHIMRAKGLADVEIDGLTGYAGDYYDPRRFWKGEHFRAKDGTIIDDYPFWRKRGYRK